MKKAGLAVALGYGLMAAGCTALRAQAAEQAPAVTALPEDQQATKEQIAKLFRGDAPAAADGGHAEDAAGADAAVRQRSRGDASEKPARRPEADAGRAGRRWTS